MILVAIYLVVIPIIASPNIGLVVAALLMLFGLIFYYPFVYRKIELKIIGKKKNWWYFFDFSIF